MTPAVTRRAMTCGVCNKPIPANNPYDYTRTREGWLVVCHTGCKEVGG